LYAADVAVTDVYVQTLWTIYYSFYFVGSVAVLVSFPFIFTRCINCTESPSWYQFAYYAPFVAIFQIGWASVQISHMALISQQTDNPSEKTELSGIRYVICGDVVHDYGRELCCDIPSSNILPLTNVKS
jgi:Na+/melibiose symporter-like transporter